MRDDTESRVNRYASIDMERTGCKIKQMLGDAGYDVKTVQKYLHLSCPQPVYRWFRGQVLPTVDHLFMLSKLLGVHMETFLVEKTDEKQHIFDCIEGHGKEQVCYERSSGNPLMYNRVLLYYQQLRSIYAGLRAVTFVV